MRKFFFLMSRVSVPIDGTARGFGKMGENFGEETEEFSEIHSYLGNRHPAQARLSSFDLFVVLNVENRLINLIIESHNFGEQRRVGYPFQG
ncbi:hypothetical protein U1Q18_035968, partial [Sarracenia purpurea var. burkii]